ncbi:MAG: DUF4129 domain-containing transglutaminase family protein [Calothrix sp. MO_192.B10]|nr:DUF4129 domain-containing transglutaminase family protein [Calothrix sp. MO_192.B10]
MKRRWHLPLGAHWREHKSSSSLTEIENSITLRALVLALVIVGVVATDIAAETQLSLWAVPLSLAGSSWSYYSRRHRNIPAKFCIAIGMLIALGAFFGRMIGELNDTRLALAQLLIQLQVLHSFDMPRRKDLGYSIVIGLILIGVAATLSQTLAFAPALLFFLGIAIPTLVLDYRSRLGLEKVKGKQKQGKSQKIFSALPSYALLFGLIVGLGLAIFAVLPRFPGYQLQTFPVSSPVEIKGDFTGRRIINPGYVRQGKDGDRGNNGNSQDSTGTGQGESGKPGKVDNNFYYGFNQEINQNLRGEMKPKVVMRVRSQSEGFWRVLAFDQYTGKGWKVSRNDEVKRLKRPPWSYQTVLNLPLFTGKSKEIVQTYTVVSDLPNLIPAMSYPKKIYFPAPVIAVDKEGGLRSPVGLSEGFTYTVVSEVPYRDRSLLGKASNKYPKSIQNYYLQVPEAIKTKVKQKTEEILANYNQQRVGKSEKNLDSTYEKVLYLAQYLKQNYSLPENPLDLPHLGEKDDLVETFLFKQKGGYPDHFSTTLTIMLRSIGIPARLVAGFAPGQFNPFTGMYVVRNTDAYAMTEVYFPKYGWFTFDPIPKHPLIPPSIEETQTFSVLRQFWQWIAGWLPSPVTGLLNYVFGNLFGLVVRAVSWFLGLFSRGWFGTIAGLTVATATAFCGWLGWEQWKNWRYRLALRKLPPMESIYQQMLQWTSTRGLGKHPSQTPLEYASSSFQHHAPHTAEVINEICQAYVKWRYGGQIVDFQGLRQKWQAVTKTHLNQSGSRRQKTEGGN